MRKKHVEQNHPPARLYFPTIRQQNCFISPKKACIYEFFSISDGCKRVYTENDALTGYGPQKIIDPTNVSYTNLFINGVLQPQKCYLIEKGKLFIHTEDIPIEGTPIILQMVKI